MYSLVFSFPHLACASLVNRFPRQHNLCNRMLGIKVSVQNDTEILVARDVPHLCASVPNVARLLGLPDLSNQHTCHSRHLCAQMWHICHRRRCVCVCVGCIGVGVCVCGWHRCRCVCVGGIGVGVCVCRWHRCRCACVVHGVCVSV